MKLAADNLNALNSRVAQAMRDLDPEPIRDLVKRCAGPGVHYIDINPGFLSSRYEDRMAFLVETVEEMTDCGLILDSPNPKVLARGLAACRRTPILSALSLEPHKIDGILPLAAQYGTPLVVLLMDERSRVPLSMDERLALAVQLRERAVAAGLDPSQLIFDPVLPNLSWPDAAQHLREVVGTVRMLSGWSVFGEPARTMVGLSNLRSGLRKKYPFEVEARCLAVLAGAGLEMVLADVLQPGFMSCYRSVAELLSSGEG
ncbi:MAG: dihydropteroate synthase [Desulfosoma sp.]